VSQLPLPNVLEIQNELELAATVTNYNPNKDYTVIRIHNGVATKLNVFNVVRIGTSAQLWFKSNKFSSFAIVEGGGSAGGSSIGGGSTSTPTVSPSPATTPTVTPAPDDPTPTDEPAPDDPTPVDPTPGLPEPTVVPGTVMGM
jgi:hypothetical protein